jgi:hypothetical protein
MTALRLALTVFALLITACGAAPQSAATVPSPVPPTPAPEVAAASTAPDPDRVRLVIFDEPE